MLPSRRGRARHYLYYVILNEKGGGKGETAKKLESKESQGQAQHDEQEKKSLDGVEKILDP